MNQDPTTELMATIFPEAFRELTEAVEMVTTMLRSGDPVFYQSPAYSQEYLIEPILNALGFAQQLRVEYHPLDHTVLSAAGSDLVIVIPKPLDCNIHDDRIELNARQLTGFAGRIVVTDGIDWSVYNPNSEVPNHYFDVTDIPAFWDLLTIGQANRPGYSPQPE